MYCNGITKEYTMYTILKLIIDWKKWTLGNHMYWCQRRALFILVSQQMWRLCDVLVFYNQAAIGTAASDSQTEAVNTALYDSRLQAAVKSQM